MITRTIVADALALTGRTFLGIDESWFFASALALLAVLLKPAYDRLVEARYWDGDRRRFVTTILVTSGFAVAGAICLGIGLRHFHDFVHLRRPLVFWDLSESTRADRSTHRAFVNTLRGLIDDGLRCPGDRIAGFLVHARTRGKAYSVEARNELELPRARGSRNEVTRDSLRYEMQLRALRDSTRRRFRALTDSVSLPLRLSRRTDLLGTVEVISEELVRRRMRVAVDGAPAALTAIRRRRDRGPPTPPATGSGSVRRAHRNPSRSG